MNNKVIAHDIVNTNRYRETQTPAISYKALALQLVKTTIMFVNALLAFRFILAAFGANNDNLLTQNIYSWSEPLVRSFFELLNKEITYTGAVAIELPTITAIATYSLIAYVLIKMITRGLETER